MTPPLPNMRLRPSLLAAALAAAAAAAAPAGAQPVTIGSPVATNTFNGLGLPAVRRLGQTFVTPAGAQTLTSYAFFLGQSYNGANLRFDAGIYDFAAGGLVGALRPGFAGSDDAVGLTAYTVPNVSLLLAPGRTYALLLTATQVAGNDPNGALNLVGTTESPSGGPGGDSYAGGAFVFEDGGGWTATDFDLAFSMTFAPAQAVVPEPGTFGLVAVGVLAGAGAMRRRRA